MLILLNFLRVVRPNTLKFSLRFFYINVIVEWVGNRDTHHANLTFLFLLPPSSSSSSSSSSKSPMLSITPR